MISSDINDLDTETIIPTSANTPGVALPLFLEMREEP